MGVDDVRERLRAKLKERIAARNAAVAKAGAKPAACRHLGSPTGDTVPCATCRGTVALKVLGCAVHGTCFPSAKAGAKGVTDCATCREKGLGYEAA